MKKTFIIHPFLFAIYPVLFLYAHNIYETSFSQTTVPAAIVLGLALLLVLLLGLLLKSKEKAGIIVSGFLILFFSYGHVWDATHVIGGIVIVRHTYLLPIWVMVFTCIAYFTIKTRKNLHDFTNILNVVTFCLIGITLINIAVYTFNTGFGRWDIESREKLKINKRHSRKADILPDIYYIVFDRYPCASTLNEFYDFDNREFIDYLEDMGFYVAAESRSNYLWSAPSLASSLNMEYINYLGEKGGAESNDHKPMYAILQDYKVWRFLKSMGYKFIHFGSWWEPTRKNKYADENLNFYALPEFSIVLYKTTMFYPVSKEFGIFNPQLVQWKRVLYKFAKLGEIPTIKEPTFVFAHMLIPHEPFVFNRNGTFLSQEEVDKRSRKVNMLDQLAFANKKIRVLIDILLSSSEVPPIIVLQGDEGPYPARCEDPYFNWKEASKAELREKMGILNAYYLPGVDKDVIYPSLTPVNSFRVIFNLYFNTNLELLSDESYANLDAKHPYEFLNVTDKVKFE